MKCSHCGLPLSPTRSACPRCGTPYASGKPSSPAKATPEWAQQQGSFVGQEQGFAPGAMQVGMESGPTWDMQGQAATVAQQPMAPPFADMPMNGDNRPAQNGFPGQPQAYAPSWQPGPGGPPASFQDARPYPHIPQRPEQIPLKRPTKVGLSLAALCVVAAGLILVFVYFMAQGLPAPTANTSTPQAMTPVGQTATAIPSPTISPTPSFPGQQYIDNAQMASSVNPLQLTSTFTTTQKIYATFSVHKSGYACLYWYENGSRLFNYPIAISPYMKTASAYGTITSAGSAYIEIYWASSQTCSDQVLAQRVDFTVTG